jgi:hypothetical protein
VLTNKKLQSIARSCTDNKALACEALLQWIAKLLVIAILLHPLILSGFDCKYAKM